ncbi:MAG: hypothetical protein WCC14_00220 [Acidobacteriaceae bacterium]
MVAFAATFSFGTLLDRRLESLGSAAREKLGTLKGYGFSRAVNAAKSVKL